MRNEKFRCLTCDENFVKDFNNIIYYCDDCVEKSLRDMLQEGPLEDDEFSRPKDIEW